MNHFIFVIPQTPSHLSNSFREALFGLTLQSLKCLVYDQWTAVIVGEKNIVEGNLIYIQSEAVTKKDKINAGIDYLKEKGIVYDYITRFDDDDIINPHCLTHHHDCTADCIADKRQLLYDIKNHRFFFAKYPWLANTVFHKREHAEAAFSNPEKYMLAGDHDTTFNAYYEDKVIAYTSSFSPLYVRIYHPFTQSIAQFYEGSKAQFDWDAYRQLLKRPNRWDRWNTWLPLGPSWFKGFKRQYRKLSKDFGF